RWARLRTAYRNAVDTSPPIMLLQEAQGRWARARSDLEQFQTRGPTGRPDKRNPNVDASFKRGVAELEQRLAAAASEVGRIEALQREANARRSALQQLIDGVRAWATAQGLTLPGDDEVRMAGFAAASIHGPTPSAAREPFNMSRISS